jgi:hypothetical protein
VYCHGTRLEIKCSHGTLRQTLAFNIIFQLWCYLERVQINPPLIPEIGLCCTYLLQRVDLQVSIMLENCIHMFCVLHEACCGVSPLLQRILRTLSQCQIYM